MSELAIDAQTTPTSDANEAKQIVSCLPHGDMISTVHLRIALEGLGDQQSIALAVAGLVDLGFVELYGNRTIVKDTPETRAAREAALADTAFLDRNVKNLVTSVFLISAETSPDGSLDREKSAKRLTSSFFPLLPLRYRNRVEGGLKARLNALNPAAMEIVYKNGGDAGASLFLALCGYSEAQSKAVQCMNLLAKLGVNVRAKTNEGGHNGLMLASENDCLEQVVYLTVRLKYNLRLWNTSKSTALCQGIRTTPDNLDEWEQSDNSASVRYLFDADKAFNLRYVHPKYGLSYIQYCAKKLKPLILGYFLQQAETFGFDHGFLVKRKDQNGLTAMHHCAKESVKNTDSEEDRRRRQMMAIKVLRILIDHGADVHATTHAGKTAMVYAQGRNADLVCAFLQNHL